MVGAASIVSLWRLSFYGGCSWYFFSVALLSRLRVSIALSCIDCGVCRFPRASRLAHMWLKTRNDDYTTTTATITLLLYLAERAEGALGSTSRGFRRAPRACGRAVAEAVLKGRLRGVRDLW